MVTDAGTHFLEHGIYSSSATSPATVAAGRHAHREKRANLDLSEGASETLSEAKALIKQLQEEGQVTVTDPDESFRARYRRVLHACRVHHLVPVGQELRFTGRRSGDIVIMLSPASEAMLRTIVDKKQLAQAVANNQGRDAAVSLASGPLGGLLLALGYAAPFLAQAASFVVMWVTNAAIDGEHRARREEPTTMWRDLRDGLAFVGRSRLILVTCGLFMILNLAMNGVVMATLYSMQMAGHRPEVIGMVTFALGAGALLGAVLAGQAVKRIPTGVLVVACMGAFAAAMVVVTIWPDLRVVLPVLGVVMVSALAVNAAVGGLLMHVVPNEMLGRVESVITFLAILMAPLSPALAGWGLGLVGLAGTYGFFALLGVGVAVVCAAYRPVRSLPRMDSWDEVRV